jgi:hypothetical protein
MGVALAAVLSTTASAGGGAATAVSDVAPVAADWQVALSSGTLGIGLDVSKIISDRFAVRANVNGLKLNLNAFKSIDKEIKKITSKVKGLNASADIDFLSAGLLLDYHPFSNGLFASAGVYYNANKLKATLTGTTLKYEGTTYSNTAVESITSSLGYNTFSPYLGIGYSNITQSGFGFTVDVGIMYSGTPKVSTTIKPGPDYDTVKATIEKARDDADKQANDEIAKQIKKHPYAKLYPVIRAGFRYNF